MKASFKVSAVASAPLISQLPVNLLILTPHFSFNYGAVLQAFALKTYIQSLGHDAILINRRPERLCAIPSKLGRLARFIEELAKQKSFGIFEKPSGNRGICHS